MTRALHSSSSAFSSHYGRSLFVSLRFWAFCKAGLVLQGRAVSEVISWWLEAVPGAPGGSWFLCSFLHLFRRSSQGGWRQLPGPKGVPGFSARSFTCFGDQYHRHCLFVAITRALHSSSSTNSSHYGRSLLVSLRLRPFARWGCFCKAGLFHR